MGILILEAVLFVLGLPALLFGWVPVTRRRRVTGSAARVVGALLMIPLPLYLIACRQSHVPPLGTTGLELDPLLEHTEGFVRLSALAAAFMCSLAAGVLAVAMSEPPRRP